MAARILNRVASEYDVRITPGEFFDGPFGAIAVGNAADVVAMDSNNRARHVCVDGRLVVQDGKLLTADHDQIVAFSQAEERL